MYLGVPSSLPAFTYKSSNALFIEVEEGKCNVSLVTSCYFIFSTALIQPMQKQKIRLLGNCNAEL